MTQRKVSLPDKERLINSHRSKFSVLQVQIVKIGHFKLIENRALPLN